MKDKKVKIVIYAIIVVLVIAILALALPKMFSDSKGSKKKSGEEAGQKYKVIKNSKQDLINYDFKDFAKDFVKIGYDEADCNDKEIVGLENVVCHGLRKTFKDYNVNDVLTLTFDGTSVVTMSVNMNYSKDDFKLETISEDVHNVINNLFNLKLNEKSVESLIKQIKEEKDTNAVSDFTESGKYKVFYNVKFVPASDVNPDYYDFNVIFYLETSITGLNTPATEAEQSSTTESSIMDR